MLEGYQMTKPCYWVTVDPRVDTDVFMAISTRFGSGPIPVLGTLGENINGKPDYVILPYDCELGPTPYWRGEWFLVYRIH